MNIQPMESIQYTCTQLAARGKKGILKPMENGYYRLPIGAIGTTNSAGFFYTLAGCRKMFEDSSTFMRRVKKGALRGEVGHPQQGDMNLDKYAARINRIDDNNICVHFLNVFLDTKNYRDEKGQPLITIVADLIPSGVHGPALQKALDNPNENVCFSVRSFTEDYMVRGVRHRDFVEVVTFDWVNEGGIPIAQKYHAAGLEEFRGVDIEQKVFTRDQLERSFSLNTNGFGLESSLISPAEMFQRFGWQQKAAPKFLL